MLAFVNLLSLPGDSPQAQSISKHNRVFCQQVSTSVMLLVYRAGRRPSSSSGPRQLTRTPCAAPVRSRRSSTPSTSSAFKSHHFGIDLVPEYRFPSDSSPPLSVYLRRLWETVFSGLQPAHTRADPHWRPTLRLSL